MPPQANDFFRLNSPILSFHAVSRQHASARFTGDNRMYLASCSHGDRDLIAVRWDTDTLVAVDQLVPGALATGDGPSADPMLTLIAAGPALLAAIARAMLSASLPAGASPIPVREVRWHPPVQRPGKIVGVAMNNSASDARKISAPNHPMFFLKPRSSLLGHLSELEIRSYYGSVHPEPELAVVIGKRARDLDPRNALDCVFGYTIMNDVTGNGMRSQDMVHYYALYAGEADSTKVERREQHLSYAARYKGTDGFAPLGPWLVTCDEIADPDALDVTCKVGTEVVAQDSTRYLTYSVAEILAFLSRFQTLDPGDVISMGTAFRQQAGTKRSLHSADLQRIDGPMQVEITGLGSLITPVRRTQAELGQWRLPERPRPD
jgi:2-keto-4-pentenoate hydratase/2-oxohepta-3-ene-1,7-dioic acid hydratase in catechol pathway